MDGQQCFGSLIDLYDIAGGIRSRLIELQNAACAAQKEP